MRVEAHLEQAAVELGHQGGCVVVRDRRVGMEGAVDGVGGAPQHESVLNDARAVDVLDEVDDVALDRAGERAAEAEVGRQAEELRDQIVPERVLRELEE